MRRFPLAIALATGFYACTPLAVTAVAGGGVITIVSIPPINKKCGGEGCVYTKMAALVGLVIGVVAMAAGGIALAAD